MNTESATALPAATIVETVDALVEGGSISVGARLTVIGHLAHAAIERGLDHNAPIDGDVLDSLTVDAIPSHLWLHA